jgi:hypothetical protein
MRYSFFFLVLLVFFIVSKISINKNNTAHINIIKLNHEKIKEQYNKSENFCYLNNEFFYSYSLNLTSRHGSEDFKNFILFIGSENIYEHQQFDELEIKKIGLCNYLKNNINLNKKILTLFDFYNIIEWYVVKDTDLVVYNPYYFYGTSFAKVKLVKDYEKIIRKGDIYIMLNKDEIKIITILNDNTHFVTKIEL